MTWIKDARRRAGYRSHMIASIRGLESRMLVVLCLMLGLGMAGTSGWAQTLPPEYDLWAKEAPAKIWTPQILTPMHERRTARHKAFIQQGVPIEYRDQTSPYPKARGVIRDGSQLYAKHCVSCHGTQGLGDGEAGKDLAPSPALLAYLEKEPEAADSYLLWTISEGGIPFKSSMPAFKDALSEREIWQLVMYMRAGFPKFDAIKKN